MKKQNPIANGIAMPKLNNFQKMLWIVAFVFCCFTTNSLSAGELPQCEVTAAVSSTNPTNGSNGSITTNVYGGNGHCLIYRLWNYDGNYWYSDYQTSSDFHNLPAGTFGVKKYSDPNCDGHYGDASCYQKLGEVQLVNEAPSCNPLANVVNNGPCPINVYEWLDSGDVYLTTIPAGGSEIIDAYDHMMLRFTDEINDWQNLLFDEHVTVGCDDQTFNVTPNNYCGHVDPPTPPAPPVNPGTPTPNPVNPSDLACPADVTVDCDGSIDPAATGSASTDAANYDISYTDAVSANGCEDVIVRTWKGVYTGSETSFTEDRLLTFDMEACESYSNDPSSSDMSEFTASVKADGVSASIFASGTQLHSCVTGAVGDKAVCIDSNDACDFSWDDEDVASFQMAVASAPGESFKVSKLSFQEVAPTWVEWANDHNNYPTKYGIRVLKNGHEIYLSEGNNTTQEWSYEQFAFDGADFTVTGSATFTFQFMGYCVNRVNNNSIEAWDLDQIKVFGGQVSNIFSDDITCNQTITRPNGVSVSAEAIDGTELNCDISSLTLTASASNGAISWEGPNGAAGNGASIEATAAGTYTASSDCACADSASITITEDAAAPAASAANDGPLTCDNDSVEISASGAGTYSWTGPNGFVGGDVASAQVSEAGTYTVTVTAANGCTSEASTTVELDEAAPSATASNDGPLTCDNSEVAITATGGGSYAWSGPNGFSGASASMMVAAPGTYTVTVTADNGCTDTASTTVESDDAVSATAANDGPLTCDNTSVTISVTGAGTYAWTGPNGFVGGDLASAQVSEAGTYTVTVTAANGCTATASTTVEADDAAPSAAASNDGPLTCDNASVEISATGEGTYSWTGPNGFVGGDVASAQVSDAGTYTVTITAANGCTDSASTTVEADDAAPSAAASNDGPITCDHPSVEISATGGGTYAWTGPNGFVGGDVASAQVSEPGTYTVTVTSANGCTDTASTTVGEDTDLPSVSADNDGPLSCEEGDLVTISASGAGTYSWTGPNGFVGGDLASAQVSDEGEYTVTITDANGCQASASTVVEAEMCMFDLALTYRLTNGTTMNAERGDDVHFKVKVFNQGTVAANNVTIVTTIPAGLELNDADWTEANGKATITLPGTIAAGDMAMVDITFTVADDAPDGYIVAIAEIMSADDAINGTAGDDKDSTPDMDPTNDAGGEVGTATDNQTDGNGTDDEDDQDPVRIAINVPLAGLGDYTFIDQNENGIQDAGDQPLEDVLVKLFDAADPSTVIAQITTNSAGYYEFVGLDPDNDYKVMFTAPDGFLPTAQSGDASNGGANDSDADIVMGMTDVIDLEPGEFDETIDAGFIPEPVPGTIGDTVFMDNNGNGVQDAGEMPLVGITLTLIAADGTQSTMVTDANGKYDFTELPAGFYMVQVGLGPDGKELTTPGSFTVNLSEGEDYNDADFGFNDIPVVCDLSIVVSELVHPTCANPFGGAVSVIVTGGTAPYVYDWSTGDSGPSVSGFPGGTCGVTVTDANGCTESLVVTLDIPSCGTIGDTVFMDNNGDAFQNPGEMGLEGIIVTLIAADGTQTSMLTNSNGNYDFTALPAGSYTVQVGAGPAGKLLSTVGSYTVNLVQGEDYNNADFGFENEPVVIVNGTIGDQVFWDANENGLFDAGEQPLSGIIVTLTAPDGSTSTLATDANGYYDFTNLPAGTYTATVGQGPVDSHLTTLGSFVVVLAQGQDYNDADFGFYTQPAPPAPPVLLGSIGDYTWIDANENQIQDAGELPIGNITITLYFPDGSFQNATTDANGYYDFTGLPAGDYTVVAGLANGYTITTAGVDYVSLGAGEDYNAADFGYSVEEVIVLPPAPPTPTGCVGDTAFLDENENGVQDAGEQGIENITMALYDEANNLLTAVTDANGHYEFCGLNAGNYSVVAGVGPDGAYITTPSFYQISLGQGQSNYDLDFGYFVPVVVDCSGQSACVEELSPTEICPTFCNLADGSYTITSAHTTFDCSIQLAPTCITYTALPGMAGFPDVVTVTAVTDSGQTETIEIAMTIGGCDGTAPATGGGIEPGPGVEPGTGGGNQGGVDPCGEINTCGAPMTAIVLCPEYCDLTFGSYEINNVESIFECNIEILDSNCIRYTPFPGFAGNEVLDITACAGGDCETATAFISVSEDCEGPSIPGVTDPTPGECSADQIVCTLPITPVDVELVFCSDADISNLSSSANANIVTINSNTFRVIPLPGFVGIINIQVLAEDADGNVETATVSVSVTPDCAGSAEPVIKNIPNAFSPNGDGVNDVFKVKDLDNSSNVSFTVVDQNGKVVFQAPQFDGNWDGSYLGQSNTVPSGTYFYIVSKGNNVQKGFIEIKK